MKDYYKILNVDKDASLEQIKKKFKKRALKYHPDKNSNESAKAKFQLAAEAFKVLSDPYKRGRYDVEYEKEQSYNGGMDLFEFPSLFGNFNDLFNFDKIDSSNKVQHYSYVSSSIGKDGKMHTKQKIKSNINGKKKNYYKEYITDKTGRKQLVKEKGDKDLITLNLKNFRLEDKD